MEVRRKGDLEGRGGEREALFPQGGREPLKSFLY